MRHLAALAALGAVVLLGACSLVPPVAFMEGVTVVGTDKTMADHAISLASGKDCSTVRAENGEAYCREDELNPTPAVYCYRTLGSVTCYDRPDPYGGRQQKVGETPGNVPRAR